MVPYGWTDKSPEREDSSSSLGDVASSLRKPQSDTSLGGTPARKGISSPPRGRGATTRPSIYDRSQPHGFDIDQVVINQHEGRAAGLPRHEDALKRKQQKMTDEANRKVKFAPTPTR